MDLNHYQDLVRYLGDQAILSHLSPLESEQLTKKAIHFTINQGTLYKKNRKDQLLQVVKETDKEAILFRIHSHATIRHFGAENTIQKIKKRFWWYDMNKDIKKYVETCDTCQRRGKPRVREELHPILTFICPLDQIGIDLVGPLPLFYKDNRYIAVATEYLTKWPEARPIPDARAVTVANFIFEDIVCHYGCPKTILSDQGTHFVNDIVNNLCVHLGIKHNLSSVYHPQTNGLTERYNRTLVETLAKIVEGSTNN